MIAKEKSKITTLISNEIIANRILFIRDKKVILDSDLAEIYGVTTKRLNEQVKRNQARFPEDFMFVLRKEELESLKSQFATSKKVRGGRRTLPFVFTEHGALMIANVLNSPIAISASIRVARAFIQMREMLTAHVDLKRKIERLEKKYESHDMQIKTVFDAIKSLLEPPKKAKKKIGF
tara:strand:+ start:1064 stop:1597 length:534 start_codon:yes stop_codon:yes gene_type:complete